MAGIATRARGMLVGTFIGDALAMPVHWYYDRAALRREYGEVRDMVAPKSPHSGSIMFRSSFTPTALHADVLHDQARFYGQPGIHYHQNLRAGENTLNLRLAQELLASLIEKGTYDHDDYTKRYIAFMTTPGRHNDTYIEECHRGFFTNYGLGKPPAKCAVLEKHIGGLVWIPIFAAFFHARPEEGRRFALQHLALTHGGEKIAATGAALFDLCTDILAGTPIRAALAARGAAAHAVFGHPWAEWAALRDDQVVGELVSPACYVQDSVPATLHLAWKYGSSAADVEAGLVANVMVGGDNCHRGAVLGALLGGAFGEDAFPERWRKALVQPPPPITA